MHIPPENLNRQLLKDSCAMRQYKRNVSCYDIKPPPQDSVVMENFYVGMQKCALYKYARE